MSERKRLHRDEPARTAPVRDFSKLYHQPDSPNGNSKSKTAQPDAPRKARTGGPLVDGVELAYSVIEKYIAEGRRTAEGISNQPYTTRAASDNLQGILERILRFQAEILPLWIETLATLVKADRGENGFAAAAGSWPRTNGGHSTDSMTASIEVFSLRPVEVVVDIRHDAEPKSLVALALNSVDSTKPALTDIALALGDSPEKVKLRIRIPENQPSGTYSGVIVNRESGETRGTLSIRIVDQS
jgi:hypothetical protein